MEHTTNKKEATLIKAAKELLIAVKFNDNLVDFSEDKSAGCIWYEARIPQDFVINMEEALTQYEVKQC